MRILLTLALATVLALAASSAGAAHPSQQSGNSASFQDNPPPVAGPNLTALKLSPMYLEIQQVLDQAGQTEQLLLKELAAATEDEDAKRIIRRIERLDVDLSLAVLKIQVRYARLVGRWDLEYRLRCRIGEILDKQVYAVK
jgi:hypothetical protein